MYAEGLLANDAEEFQQELPVNDTEGSQHDQGEEDLMPARVDALLAVWASSSKDFFHCFAVSLPRVGKGPSLRGGRGPWARTGEWQSSVACGIIEKEIVRKGWL